MFEPIALKFGKFTNFGMLFKAMGFFCQFNRIQLILNIRTQSPARLEHGYGQTLDRHL